MNLRDRRASDEDLRKSAARSRETLGMVIIVLLILAIVIARSWHFMKWSIR